LSGKIADLWGFVEAKAFLSAKPGRLGDQPTPQTNTADGRYWHIVALQLVSGI
jgi:hypothetical protein